MDFWRVLGRFWEAKILYFPTFFDVVWMLNFERCFESKNLRKKCQKTKVWRLVGPGRRNVRGAGERKREGFRSLLGQNSGKKYFLGKHFRCSDRRKPLPFESSTLVPGGAADRFAHAAGPWLREECPREWQPHGFCFQLTRFRGATFPNHPKSLKKKLT